MSLFLQLPSMFLVHGTREESCYTRFFHPWSMLAELGYGFFDPGQRNS